MEKTFLIWITGLNTNEQQENQWLKDSFDQQQLVPFAIKSKIDVIHLNQLSKEAEHITDQQKSDISNIIADIVNSDSTILANKLIIYYLNDWIELLNQKKISWKLVCPFVPLELYLPKQVKDELHSIKVGSTIFNRFKKIKAFHANINQHHLRFLEIWKIMYSNLKKAKETNPDFVKVCAPYKQASVSELSSFLLSKNFIKESLSFNADSQELKSKNYKDKDLQVLHEYFENLI